MSQRRWLLAIAVALVSSPRGADADPLRPGERLLILEMSPLPPTPPNPTNAWADSAEAAALGERLFHDCDLSGDGNVACATCHDPAKSFADGIAISLGAGRGRRNTPAIWNVAQLRWLFWDGRADSLWAQALQPIESAVEMNGSRRLVYGRIAGDAEYARRYESLFGPLPPPDQEGVDFVFVAVGKSIEAFQRTLVSDDAPFDRYVAWLRHGETGIAPLDAAAVRGLRLFVGRANCVLCHNGPLLSDNEFHNLGLAPAPGLAVDVGRFDGIARVLADPFNGVGRHSDDSDARVNDRLRYLKPRPSSLGEMRTPSLRNVALTAPYMHDGRFATLRDVLRFYSELDDIPALGEREATLTPLALSDGESDDLVAFLRSLSGDGASASRGR